MGTIADLSDLVARMSGGNNGNPETQFFQKTARIQGAAATVPVAGRAASLWQYDGMPAGGASPTTAAIPTRSTIGAIPFAPATGGRDKLLISAGLAPSVGGVFLLYDRLFHIGGLSGISTADQTIQGSPASPALTRNTGGAGNFAFYEIYTAVGASSVTLTMTYTNQSGVAGQTSTIGIGATGFREATRAQRIPLAAGDSGLRAVEKIRLAGSTTTQGEFGLVIAQPIAWIPVGAAGAGGWRDYTTGLPGIPAIHPDACLSLLCIPSSGAAPEVFGALSFVEA